MNNEKKIISIGLLALFGVGLSSGINFTKEGVKEASAYSTSPLPTTIDLNDSTASDIRNYYKDLNSLDSSERQGNNLLKNLKEILKYKQNYFSYDSGSSVWQMYEITDRDWEKSPASSTTYGTYDSVNNVINNYSYGVSASKSKNNPYIHALYINRNVENLTTAWDNHAQDEWGINREHVWPKAEGFETSAAGGARGDPMHLMAGNGWSNNIHSNYYYGYVKTSVSYTDCGDKYSNQRGNLRGVSKTLNSGTVFEPQDCDKGDIARAIFYMVARYNYLSGSDSDGIDSNNPNLELVNNVSDWSSKGYDSTTSKTGKMGILTDLLAWHHADPVDEYEIHRNNLLYKNFTNNRNPFIDFPEWVDFIWGTATYNGSTYQSYSSVPTGYATPSSDTINGYNEGGQPQVLPTVDSVSVSPASLNVTVGSTGNLSATVNVSNGASQDVTWTSSNTNIATVNSSGVVAGVAAGNATITVRSVYDNTKYATCSVTVSTPSGGGGNTKADVLFAKGFASYTDTSLGDSGIDYTAVANSTNSTGVSYALQVFKGSNGQVRGNQGTATNNFSARNTSTKAGYYISSVSLTVSGGTLDGSTSGRSVVYFGSSAYANPTDSAPSGDYTSPSPSESGQTTLTWTNSSQSNNYFILYNLKTGGTALSENAASALTVTWTPKEKTLSSITLTNPTTAFVEGDEFSFGGTVTANYSDDSSTDVTASAVFTGYNMTNISNQTVTVSFGGKTATYDIAVNIGTPTSLIVYGYSNEFEQYDEYHFDGTCILELENGYNKEVIPDSVTSPNMSTAGNKTVTLSYTYNSVTVTKDIDIFVNRAAVNYHGMSPADSLTVSEAIAICQETGETVTSEEYYTHGYISNVVTYFSKYKDITFKISDDGTQNNELTVYGCKDVDNNNFSSLSDLSVGMEVIIVGNLYTYVKDEKQTPEYTLGCYIYEYVGEGTSVSKRMSEAGFSNEEVVETVTFYNQNEESIVGTFDKGTGNNTPKYYDTGTSVRMYGGNTLTITSTKTNIMSIVFSFGGSDGSNEITTDVGEYSDGTWTGNESSVTFTIGGTSGNRRIARIKVYYFGALEFARYFQNNIGCDESGNTSPSGSWSTMSSKFNTLFIADKNALKNAAANENGTDIEHAMATYDYIIRKYGTSTYSNFIARNGLSSNAYIPNFVDNKFDLISIILVATSLVGITLTAAFIFIKRKKQG